MEASSSSSIGRALWDTKSWASWEELLVSLRTRMSGPERLAMLEELGSCKAAKCIDTRTFKSCSLSALEWETLLRSLKSSPNLEELTIWLDTEVADDIWFSISRCWGEILESVSSLKKLDVRDDSRSSNDRLVSLLQQLATGLQGNRNRTVEELCIEFSADHRSSCSVLPVADMVQCSLRLRKLCLSGLPKLDGMAVKPLSDALKQRTSLHTLEIRGSNEGIAPVLLEAFTGEESNQSLKELLLSRHFTRELGCALPHLLKAKISQVQVCISNVFCSPHTCHGDSLLDVFPWGEIGRALLEIADRGGLQRFTVLIAFEIHSEAPSFSEVCGHLLKEVWETSKHSPLLEFSLDVGTLRGGRQDISLLPLLSTASLRNIDLNVVTTFPTDALQHLEKVMDTLNQNQSVLTCNIGFERDNRSIPDRVRLLRSRILEKLCHNTSLQKLTLRSSFFECVTEEDFKESMTLLHRNFALKQIRVECDRWMHDGKAALIQDAINRNATHARYISLCKEAGLRFSTIKAGRVLFCGSPYAGKTRLKKTMLRVERTSGFDFLCGEVVRFMTSWLDWELFRTKGIEITTLRDDEEMNVSIWDFGGQWIFRALQDLFFPKIGQACIYLFVFNPFEIVSGKRCKRADLLSTFEKELRSWLRYVASHYPIRSDLRPEMMVILSHKDKIQSVEMDLKTVSSVIDKLCRTFRGRVDLSPGEEIHFINCFDSGDASAVTESIFRRMGQIFDKLMAKDLVPESGIELTSLFSRRPIKIRNHPVWSTSDLYDYFCNQDIDGLRHLNRQSKNGKEILQALAQYLHGVGIIILIPDSDLVVVDPDWMTEKFLGELISHCHSFQPGRTILKDLGSFQGLNGFIDSHILDRILSTCVETYGREGIEVSREHLQELLFKLDLCIQLDADDEHENRRYFMPAICGPEMEKLPSRKLQWKSSSHEGLQDFGFRLRCLDRERTCFTKSFFPTFEIKLKNKLVQELKMDVSNVKCRRGLVEIWKDGHQIFLECDELAEDYIDIMVRSSSLENKEMALKFVEENIIDFLYRFCTFEMGYMGVSLSMHILRTECVTKLTPRNYRGDDQVIPVGELTMKLEEDVKKQLDVLKMKSEKDAEILKQSEVWNEDAKKQLEVWNRERIILETRINDGLQHVHWWPEIKHPDPAACLPRSCASTKDLLPPKVLGRKKKELKRMVEKFGEDLEKFVQNLREMLEKEVPERITPSFYASRTHEDEVIRLSDDVYEIYSPLGVRPCVELVFFHGICEDESDKRPYLTTWSTRRNRDECWLNTWLVSQKHVDLTQARVLTVTYYSNFMQAGTGARLDNYLVAENLAHSLIGLADVGQHDCPVVLVGHSFGGLVLKHVCLLAARRGVDSGMHENFLLNLGGVCFYSTPHRGISHNFIGARFSIFLEDLPRLSHHFDQLRRRYGWKTMGLGETDKTELHLLEEGRESAIMELVVNEASARIECDSFNMIPKTDHFTICRPESVNSVNFLALVKFIQDVIANRQD